MMKANKVRKWHAAREHAVATLVCVAVALLALSVTVYGKESGRKAFMDVPVWYASYRIHVSAALDIQRNQAGGAKSRLTGAIDRTLTGAVKLDWRIAQMSANPDFPALSLISGGARAMSTVGASLQKVSGWTARSSGGSGSKGSRAGGTTTDPLAAQFHLSDRALLQGEGRFEGGLLTTSETSESWEGSGPCCLQQPMTVDVNLNSNTCNVALPYVVNSSEQPVIEYHKTGFTQEPSHRTQDDPVTRRYALEFMRQPEEIKPRPKLANPGIAYLSAPLPDKVRAFTLSATLHGCLRTPGQGPEVDEIPVALEIEVRLSPTPPKAEELELRVSSPGYRTWLPEAGGQQQPVAGFWALVASLPPSSNQLTDAGGAPAAGGLLEFKAMVADKDGAPTKKKVTFRFALTGVSKEKGVCVNDPGKGAGDELDLLFEPGAAVQVDEQGQTATCTTDKGECKVLVRARDYGASGALRVTASTDDGKTLQAIFEGKPTSDILLPDREPGSKIAQRWKKENGLTGLPDDFDDETTPGNSHKGDGITLYEHYRGVMAKGRHVRLSPKQGGRWLKHFFVVNELGRGAEAGFALLEKASGGIRVVALDRNELSKDRVVNFSSASGSASQHGVVLRAPNAGETSGDVVGTTLPADTKDLRPGKTEAVVIDISAIERGYKSALAVWRVLPYTLEADIAQTVAHELAHALGVNHHGDVEDSHPVDEVTKSMDPKVYRVYDSKGNLVAPPVKITGYSARTGGFSFASGDMACIICYTNFYQWYYITAPGKGYEFHATRPLPVGTTFCTGPDDPKKPNVWFGPASPKRGNCLGRLTVKDSDVK